MTKHRRIIVAIGGGHIRKRPDTTASINREIIRLTGKKSPSLLFLPTASSDSDRYVRAIQRHFGDQLGCKVSALFLLHHPEPRKKLRARILSSDIIYVGGGNTLMMMKRWKTLGVDSLLREAYRRGIILCGISAGSIRWFEYGHSDSLSFYHPRRWEYIRVKGLGLLQGIHCPHYDGHTGHKRRRASFTAFMKKYPQMGIAIDNCCAIFFRNNAYRVIRSKRSASAYRVWRKNGKIIEDQVPRDLHYRPLKEVYAR